MRGLILVSTNTCKITLDNLVSPKRTTSKANKELNRYHQLFLFTLPDFNVLSMYLSTSFSFPLNSLSASPKNLPSGLSGNFDFSVLVMMF